MYISDKNQELVVSFNELEMDNEFIVQKVIAWLQKKDFLRNKHMLLCKWQTIKEPTIFQIRRGFLADSNLKDKIIKKFSVKRSEGTCFMAIMELNIDELTPDFILKYCFVGQIFFVQVHRQSSVLEDLEREMCNDENLFEKTRNNDLSEYVNSCKCLSLRIQQYDNPVSGICEYKFSLMLS